MYKAFLQTGDTERAAREKEKMDAAYEEMGDWNIAADSIREKLGVEPCQIRNVCTTIIYPDFRRFSQNLVLSCQSVW